jgi:hypothetical protein
MGNNEFQEARTASRVFIRRAQEALLDTTGGKSDE